MLIAPRRKRLWQIMESSEKLSFLWRQVASIDIQNVIIFTTCENHVKTAKCRNAAMLEEWYGAPHQGKWARTLWRPWCPPTLRKGKSQLEGIDYPQSITSSPGFSNETVYRVYIEMSFDSSQIKVFKNIAISVQQLWSRLDRTQIPTPCPQTEDWRTWVRQENLIPSINHD